jgi:hypothetical protein
MPDDDIKWVDAPPPTNKGGRPRGGGRLDTLLERPGRWAAFPVASVSHGTSAAHSLRRAAELRGVKVESTSRSNPDGSATFYARVVES